MAGRTIDCFVIMPIRGGSERLRWLHILEHRIRPAVEAAIQAMGYEAHVWRVDDEPESGNWLRRIVEGISRADLVVADLTHCDGGCNPNVMWELGLRHAASPSGTIIIAQNLSMHVPSDIRSYQAAEYREDGSADGAFRAEIASYVKTCLATRDHIDSPFHQFAGSQAMHRHISVELQVGRTVVGAEQPWVEVQRFSESEPAGDVSTMVAARELAVLGADPAAAASYLKEVQAAAPAYIAAQKRAWEVRRARFQAQFLRPIVWNKGQREVTDVEVSLRIRSGARLFEKESDLPPEPKVPALPSPPRRPLTASVAAIAGSHRQIIVERSMHDWQAIVPRRNGWVDDDNLSARFTFKRCRQESDIQPSDGVLLLLDDPETPVEIGVEVRTPDLQGVWRQTIWIRPRIGQQDSCSLPESVQD